MMTEMRKACAVAMLEVVLVWGFRHHLYSPYQGYNQGVTDAGYPGVAALVAVTLLAL